MSKMKKYAGLLVAMIMVFAMAVTANAAEQNFEITLPDNGHTYEIYQIFTGDLSSDGVLSNVKKGQNFNGDDAAVKAALKDIEDNAKGSDTAKLDVIGKYVSLSSPFKTGKAAKVSVPAGYYLVKDVDGAFKDQDDAYTKYIVQVVKNVTIEPKSGKPELIKKVKDTNDTTGVTTGWQDSADYDIGDTIPYQLTATMGDIAAFDTYWIEFTDTMTKGLTYNSDAVVKMGDQDVSSSFTIASSKVGDNTVLKVSCDDVKALGATKGTKITVDYTCTLNKDAVIGSAGNPNTAYLEYSNNPNKDHDGEHGKTPEDKNIVFTFKVVANKIKADKTALVGASFKLEKKLANGTWKDLGTVNGTNASTFAWTGIDDGIYKITETVTPAGYNSIEPIEFEVKAGHTQDPETLELTSLTGDDKFNGEVATGQLTADIVNESGATLPSTGGMGTRLFYLIGAICVIGAGILLISRKRVSR